MKLGLKATLITVMIFALCLSAVAGVTQSWYSDEERATIDVSTATVGVDPDACVFSYRIHGDSPEQITTVPFENDTVTLSNIPDYHDGQEIVASYWVNNQSTVDSFLAININLVGIEAKSSSIEVRKEGNEVVPIDGWYYGMVPGERYHVRISIGSTGTGSVSITNNAVLNISEVPVTTEFDLKRAIASSNLNKPIVVSGDIVCSSPIEIGRTLTLEIDGTIKTVGREAITVSSGTLTLSNRGSTSIVQSESYDGATVRILPGAYMNLNGVSIKSDGYGIFVGNIGADSSDASAVLWMKEGIINSVDSAIIVGKSSQIYIHDSNLTSSDHVIQAAGPSLRVTVSVKGGLIKAGTSDMDRAVCGVFANSTGDWTIDEATFNITNGVAAVARYGDTKIFEINYTHYNSGFNGGRIDEDLSIDNIEEAAVVTYRPDGSSSGMVTVNDHSYDIDNIIRYYDCYGLAIDSP